MLPRFDSRNELDAARQRLTQALVELDRRRLRALSGSPSGASIETQTGKPSGAVAPRDTSPVAGPRVEPSAGAVSLAERLRAWFAAGRQR